MPINLVSKKEYYAYPETLCLSCARSWSNLCWYWRLKDPERGLELMGAEAVKVVLKYDCKDWRNQEVLYKVIRCPHFTKAKEEGR